MKNKKIWLIIGSICFLAVIIFVIFAVTHESDPNTKLTHLKNELQPKQKLESKQEKKTQKDNQLQKQKEAEKQGQADQQVREAFESALQKTADFFSQKKRTSLRLAIR
ncbi:hypothetical protein P5G51_002740 [Virgibacillus sp. 179-BFC.A HS]|uniref:Uncharacterized protein n=1 Tax=Tigheibacillus jepli TaxID=3035914 RepID=A0ABU5CFZ4_9BACI|nr:hypothetical protein [Virgibacillus sp. 179-BFC.A HS]MDY0404470.1 hypothetical protein [Virgibacillus sp. 179-BFC.A HS]